jgi:L,D-transpeptidase YcbB
MVRLPVSGPSATILGARLAGASIALFATVMLACGGALAEGPSGLADAIRQQLGAPTRANERETRALQAVYLKRGYQPIWLSDRGPTPKARLLVERLERAGEQGLRPADYDADRLAAALRDDAHQPRAALDLLLSRALVRYGADVKAGRIVRPRRATHGFYMQTVRPDPERLLEEAADAPDFARFLDRLPPLTPEYRRLVGALAFYRAIAKGGGWSPVPAGPTLKPGMDDPRVALVRRRLQLSGDLKATREPATHYGAALAAAVRRFQTRHGLTQDGAVGRSTLAAMNVPADKRVEQIVLNLERRRWMPDDLGDRYVFVNIADQEVKLVVNAHSAKQKTIFAGRVIVGRYYHSTPIFSAMMTSVELNPHWNVPQSIARRELLPSIKKNPGYLARNHYLLLTRPLDNASAINPRSVDWTKMTARSFPYWIRQTPGPWNALGSLVFRLPNPHNVYLHDTPSKRLFESEVRTFSHGCIRVQNPIRLALLVLAANREWNAQRITRTIETRIPTTIVLRQPLPVHVTYLTAWSNKDGTHNFRRDVYHRDAPLARLLARKARVAN